MSKRRSLTKKEKAQAVVKAMRQGNRRDRMYYTLDKDGNPCEEPNVLKWAKWFEQGDKRVVAKTKVGSVEVSTVFLGLNHNWLDDGPPILYETMVFGGERDANDIHNEISYTNRYATREQALEGHKFAVAMVRRDLRKRPPVKRSGTKVANGHNDE